METFERGRVRCSRDKGGGGKEGKRKKKREKTKKRLARKKRKAVNENRWADYTIRNRLRRDAFARIYQAFVLSFFNLSNLFVSRSFNTYRRYFLLPSSIEKSVKSQVYRLFLQLRLAIRSQSVPSLVKVSLISCVLFFNTYAKLIEESKILKKR